MKVAIRYYSRTGNTKKLACAIQEQLGVAAESIDIPIPYDIELLFLGTSTYGGRMAREISDFIPTLKHRKIKVVAFSSSLFRKSNYQFLHKQLSNAKVLLLPENFHSGRLTHLFRRQCPNDVDLKKIKTFSQEIVRKYLL